MDFCTISHPSCPTASRKGHREARITFHKGTYMYAGAESCAQKLRHQTGCRWLELPSWKSVPGPITSTSIFTQPDAQDAWDAWDAWAFQCLERGHLFLHGQQRWQCGSIFEKGLICFVFNVVCICVVCVGTRVHGCRCLWGVEEGTGSPAVRVTGNASLLTWVQGTKLRSLREQ